MQADLFKSMEGVIVDKKMGGDGGLSFLDTLRVNLGFSRETSSKMKSEDRVKYAQMFYDYMNNYLKTVMSDPGYKAVLKDIDTQMNNLQKEIESLDKELGTAPDDKEKRRQLDDRREKIKMQK